MKREISEVEAFNNNNKSTNYLSNRFVPKVRLNLNDLLKRKMEEKKLDKKTNLLIFSGAATVAAVVFVILSL